MEFKSLGIRLLRRERRFEAPVMIHGSCFSRFKDRDILLTSPVSHTNGRQMWLLKIYDGALVKLFSALTIA